VQRGGQAGGNGGWIGHGTTKDPGMQVDRGAMHARLQAGDAAQAVSEGADTRRDHAGVGDGHDVAGKGVAVGFQKGTQVRAADLFLALEEDRQVHRQFAVAGEGFREAGDMGHELALVVGGAARIDAAFAQGGFEGWRQPLAEGFRRLDIVVAIQQDRAAAGLMGILRHQHRVAGCFVQGGVKAERAQFGEQPVGAGAHVAAVLGIGGHAGKAQAGEEVVEGAHGRGKGLRGGGLSQSRPIIQGTWGWPCSSFQLLKANMLKKTVAKRAPCWRK
jgi:hypothetical protein